MIILEVQRVETIDKVVYRPWIVSKTKFFWWTFERNIAICKTPGGSFYETWITNTTGQASDDCDTEVAALELGREYLKYLAEKQEREDFGTRRSVAGEYEILKVDKEKGVIFRRL